MGCGPLTVIWYHSDEASYRRETLARYTEAGWSSTVLDTSRPERTGTNAPCAIVPLKPNELSRPDDSQLCAHAITSAGMSNEADETIDDKCKFNLRLDFSDESTMGSLYHQLRTVPTHL